jgi:hypothetical protein
MGYQRQPRKVCAGPATARQAASPGQPGKSIPKYNADIIGGPLAYSPYTNHENTLQKPNS